MFFVSLRIKRIKRIVRIVRIVRIHVVLVFPQITRICTDWLLSQLIGTRNARIVGINTDFLLLSQWFLFNYELDELDELDELYELYE